MKKIIKQLFLWYLIFVIVKSVLSYFILAPTEFNDGYIYAKIARSFFHTLEFSVSGNPIHRYPPIYPIVLSVSYIFNDMTIVYFAMKIINSIVSSLIIFPAWLLSREFFTEKKALIAAILVSVIPSSFAYSFFIMSENLAYPLFLFAFYFSYKSFTEKTYKWNILAGVFIGLSYLTKGLIVMLLPAIIFTFLVLSFKNGFDLSETKRKIVMVFSSSIIIFPWLFRNISIFGNSIFGLFGSYSTQTPQNLYITQFQSFISWPVIYLGFLMMSTAFIFFPMSFYIIKKKENLTFSLLYFTSIISLLIILASHNLGGIMYETFFPWLTGRPQGRLLDIILPLVFISGMLGFDIYKKQKSKLFNYILIASLFILIFSTQLIFFPLFPINNVSLAWMGAIKYIFDLLSFSSMLSFILFSVLFLMIILFFYISHIKNKLKFNKLLPYFIIFFVLVSMLNFTIIFFNSKIYWHDGEQMQLGLWFNSYDNEKSVVLFDKQACTGKILKTDQSTLCEIHSSATIMGFWMNDDIIISDIPNNLDKIDYIITRNILNLQLIKESESGIKIYKTKAV